MKIFISIIIIVLSVTCGIFKYQLDRAITWRDYYKEQAQIHEVAFDRLVAKDRGDNSNYPYVLKKKGD